MAELLLQTKLSRPSLRPSLVSRPSLIEKLNSGQDSRLLLIVAPAGFGKTTLAASWLSQAPRPSVWVSLDEDDNDPLRFFTYLSAAVQQIQGVTNWTQKILESSQPASLKSLATALINDCAAAEAATAEAATASTPFILALDDYHVISEQTIHEAVTYLLDHLPPQVRLLLTSRTDPLLPLPRLRARGQLTELRTEDLRFDRPEAAAFLQQLMRLNLTAQQITALEARTEGWIAGLQLAALSIQGLAKEVDIATFIGDFAGSNRYIFDYLTDEVLAQRPPETQTFLLQTSILDRFSAELCTAVTANPDSQAVLRTLESANLFLFPLDDKRQWYRYHHLFADLLRRRLSRRPRQEIQQLHLRAANWFEAEGLLDQAIKHYHEAADQESIARLVIEHGSMILQPGQLHRLQGWLDALGPRQVRNDAQLAALQAWIYYFEQNTEQVATWVDRAWRQLGDSNDRLREGDVLLQGSLVGLQAWLAIQAGRFDQAVQMTQRALNMLPETEPVWRGIVYVFWGQALFGSGRTAEAIAVYEDSLRYNSAARNWVATSALTDAIMMTLTFRAHLSEASARLDRVIATLTELGETVNATEPRLARLTILYERNDLAAVKSELSQLYAITKYDTGIATVRYLYNLAIYLTATGDHEEALRALQQMEDAVSTWTTPDEQARAIATIMRIYLRLGKRRAPLAWLHSLDVDRSSLTLLRVTEYLAIADIARFSSSSDAQRKGLDLLQAVHQLIDDAAMDSFKLEAFCLQALLLATINDENKALVALAQALNLAEPEGYVRTLVDFGPPMSTLLQQSLANGIHPDYAGFLLAQFSPESAPQRDRIKRLRSGERLSARELDVLSLLATHLNGPEIAGHLHISLNTYKTHTKNIYSKLGVSSRAAAVAQARRQGLLPSR